MTTESKPKGTKTKKSTLPKPVLSAIKKAKFKDKDFRETPSKNKRGFASMTPQKRREVSSKGGRNSHKKDAKKAHQNITVSVNDAAKPTPGERLLSQAAALAKVPFRRGECVLSGTDLSYIVEWVRCGNIGEAEHFVQNRVQLAFGPPPTSVKTPDLHTVLADVRTQRDRLNEVENTLIALGAK